MGLVLARKEGEAVLIGPSIIVRVVKIRGSRAILRLDAPKETPIVREEIADRYPLQEEKP